MGWLLYWSIMRLPVGMILWVFVHGALRARGMHRNAQEKENHL